MADKPDAPTDAGKQPPGGPEPEAGAAVGEAGQTRKGKVSLRHLTPAALPT
jgi:hypothetical protein